jgi:hypothetical protein
MKVFISHSSKDKDSYVDIVVEKLRKLIGVDRLVYDAITFEKGEEINAEIREWLDKSDIFVIFYQKMHWNQNGLDVNCLLLKVSMMNQS